MTLNYSSYLHQMFSQAGIAGICHHTWIYLCHHVRKQYNIIKKSHHFFLQPSKSENNSTSHRYLLR